jgi:CRISPR system Cascade subunit CasE
VSLRDLRRVGAVQGLGADEGRTLHHLLSEAFGKGAVQPFRLLPGRDSASFGTLYGYSNYDEVSLREAFRETAAPELAEVLDIAHLAVKAMPERWSAGRRLAFDIRVRPVRRLLKPLEGSSREARRDPGGVCATKGSEVDAFVVARLRAFPDGLPPATEDAPSREDVYRDWLEQRLGRDGAAALDVKTTRLKAYERRKVLRGGIGVEGPDAVLHGELIITDPAAFTALLARGVGRHAAYGYGMLLLRPARR